MFRKKVKLLYVNMMYDHEWTISYLLIIYILILLFFKNTHNQIYSVIWSFKQKAGINKTITNKWTCSFMKLNTLHDSFPNS